MTPIPEDSLRRYAGIIQALLPSAVGIAICDDRGETVQLLDLIVGAETEAAIDYLRDAYPKWVAADGLADYALPAAGQSIQTFSICDIQCDPIAALVVVTNGKSLDKPVLAILDSIAECIAHEIELNTELDSMTTELTERYEELNLVYHTEDQVNYFRESQEALQNLTQNCLDYLDVGLSVLILKGKGIATSCHHPLNPISNGPAVASRLAGKLYQRVHEKNDTVVINEMSDPLALTLLPGLPYRVLCCPVMDASGAVSGILATVNHFSKPKFSNSDKNLLQVISRKASKIIDVNYDALTGLINRNGYEHYLDYAYQQIQESAPEKCLLHINIDQMHIVNDTVSFAAGDDVIRSVAKIIESKKRDGDTLSRLGGDEFGVMLDRCSFPDAVDFAERVCREIEGAEIEFDGGKHKITVSIGVAMMSASSESVAQVMGVAEVACSVAKDQGRNRVETYRPDDQDMVRREEQMHLVAHIQKALAEDNFVLYCQPILALGSSSRVQHTEVLLRIIDEDGRVLAPGNFIPAAERYHLMPSIDRWVVSKTLSMLSEYDEELLSGCIVAINLSGQSLNESSFLEFVRQEIRMSGIPPQCLCFEVTETAAVANLNRAIEFIGSLKKIGCSFSLDDFGSGVSSFGYLKSLPVDYLKIDGSIVKDIVTDKTSAAMVAAINQVGHTMNLRTIAEYVENDEIKLLLEEIGVDYVQGYGIGKPAPFTDRLQALLNAPAAMAS